MFSVIHKCITPNTLYMCSYDEQISHKMNLSKKEGCTCLLQAMNLDNIFSTPALLLGKIGCGVICFVINYRQVPTYFQISIRHQLTEMFLNFGSFVFMCFSCNASIS